MADLTPFIFAIISALKAIDVDYTPRWGRGDPPFTNFINTVTFPRVLTTKAFKYRVVHNTRDLGVRAANAVEADGSQKLNFLEWNEGEGFIDTSTIKVYVVDPDNGNQYLVAQWN